MRYAVETWAPEYGASLDEGGLEVTSAPVDPNVEVPAGSWRPLRPAAGERPARVLFVDGVRRVDARVWIHDDHGGATLGVCATVAAGAVCAEPGRASLVGAAVHRGVYSAAPGLSAIDTVCGVYQPCRVADGSPDALVLGVQDRMAALEAKVAAAVGDGSLVVVDGPLRGRQHVPGAVGYVKTQHVRYLPDSLQAVVAALDAGERTPLFCVGGEFARLSWYLRLPGEVAHPLAGVVRCEQNADVEVAVATATADLVSALLPAFASKPHKDSRAPQNLYPIAGLERELRRRLGDPSRAERALRRAASAS
ncbi:MAG TPA: hypothetical protein VF183_05875 [Acidimicrobiales bacterium]